MGDGSGDRRRRFGWALEEGRFGVVGCGGDLEGVESDHSFDLEGESGGAYECGVEGGDPHVDDVCLKPPQTI